MGDLNNHNHYPRSEPVTGPGETAEFWLDLGRPEDKHERIGNYAGRSEVVAPPAPLSNDASELFGLATGDIGEGGDQAAPLGRAVIGGLIASTFAALFILPLIFAWVQGKTSTASVSLDPSDKESKHYISSLYEANEK